MYTAMLMAALSATSPGFHGYGCGCNVGYPYSYNPGCYGCAYYGSPAVGGGTYGYHGAYDPGYTGCTGCYGCYGGYSCYGIAVPGASRPSVAQVPRDPYPAVNPNPKEAVPDKDDAEEVAAPKEKKKTEDKKAPEPEKKADEKKKLLRLDHAAPIRAKVRIEVPEGGKLFVDDHPINVSAGTHVFQTPPLAGGERYFYDIRIDWAGESRTRRVIIDPGQEVAVSFPGMAPAAHASR